MTSYRRDAQVAALLSVLMVTAEFREAQANHNTVAQLLEEQVQARAVTAYRVQKYCQLLRDAS